MYVVVVVTMSVNAYLQMYLPARFFIWYWDLLTEVAMLGFYLISVSGGYPVMYADTGAETDSRVG